MLLPDHIPRLLAKEDIKKIHGRVFGSSDDDVDVDTAAVKPSACAVGGGDKDIDASAFDGKVPEGAAPSLEEPLFAPVSAKLADHVLRELSWGEQFVASSTSVPRVAIESWFYGLGDAATFFGGSFPFVAGTGAGGSYRLVDIAQFIAWVRTVVGDNELAQHLEQRVACHEAYTDQIYEIGRLLALRLEQLRICLENEHNA